MNNLSILLRPKRLEDVIGNRDAVNALRDISARGITPRAIMFSGPPGTGKTTLANIAARVVQGPDFPEEDSFELREINAAADNSVASIRQLVDDCGYVPFSGRVRVILLNEAQDLTPQAQEVLQDPLEAKDSCNVWILTTKNPAKIDQAIQDRCKHFRLKPLSNKEEITELVLRADEYLGIAPPCTETSSFIDFVFESKVGSSRVILQAYEQYVSGIPLSDCLAGDGQKPEYKDIAHAVITGRWSDAKSRLAQIQIGDARAMRTIVSGQLRYELLKCDVGLKADAIATCLVGLGSSVFEDGIAWSSAVGLLYKCAKAIGGSK